MPRPGNRWYHIVINARGSWYTGDPRGFHSRNHRKHSTGDYKSPPPTGEHAGLYRHIRSNSRPPISFHADLWAVLGTAILEKIRTQGLRVVAVCVDAHHAHLLVELPGDRRQVKQTVGTWKQYASHQIRDRLPGEVWSKSCDPIQIANHSHHLRVYRYILAHAAAGAWVWSYRDETDLWW